MTISNIQFKCFTDENREILRRDVIYDRENSDGTIDKIERIWEVYLNDPHVIEKAGSLPHSSYIENAGHLEIPEVMKYILFSEENFKNYHPKNVNVNMCSALLSQVRLFSPKPGHNEITKLNNQIQNLTQKVNELNQENARLSAINEKQQKELKKTLKDLEPLIKILNIQLDRR